MARAAEVDELAQALRRVGLRATPSRIAVLGLLREGGGPRSHAEVVETLGGGVWDRATVYRNLIDLVDAALVRRSDVDHVWRFEAVGAGGEVAVAAHPAAHPHFVCVACGEIECLPELELTVKRGKDRTPRAMRAKQIEIQVRGRCDACS
jgi:Fur family ferric uptake transcriptional regulator